MTQAIATVALAVAARVAMLETAEPARAALLVIRVKRGTSRATGVASTSAPIRKTAARAVVSATRRTGRALRAPRVNVK